jgi:hypothetical protein
MSTVKATVLFSRRRSCEKTKPMGWRRVSLVLLAMSIAACSESGPPAAPGGGTGASGGTIVFPPTGGAGGDAGTGGSATGGSGGTSGSGGSVGSGGSGGTVGTGGQGGETGTGGLGGIIPTAACANGSDNQLLTDLVTGAIPTNGRYVAHLCGDTTCAPSVADGEAAFRACATDCIVEAISGLSNACGACYGRLAWDAVSGGCNATCSETPESACGVACAICDNDNYRNWLDDLDECAGRRSEDCPQ